VRILYHLGVAIINKEMVLAGVFDDGRREGKGELLEDSVGAIRTFATPRTSQNDLTIRTKAVVARALKLRDVLFLVQLDHVYPNSSGPVSMMMRGGRKGGVQESPMRTGL